MSVVSREYKTVHLFTAFRGSGGGGGGSSSSGGGSGSGRNNSNNIGQYGLGCSLEC
jgi:hypothetical protein